MVMSPAVKSRWQTYKSGVLLAEVANRLEGTGRLQLIIEHRESVVAAKLVMRAGDEMVGGSQASTRPGPGSALAC